MSLLRWFMRRSQPEPAIEPSPAARLRLAQATRGHAQVARRLATVALNEVDRTAAENGSTVGEQSECLGRAVAELTQRYRTTQGRKPADHLAEMVDFMSKGRK